MATSITRMIDSDKLLDMLKKATERQIAFNQYLDEIFNEIDPDGSTRAMLDAQKAEHQAEKKARRSKLVSKIETIPEVPMADYVHENVLSVLRLCRIVDDKLYLPAQLERKLYVRVNEVLERLGATWVSGKVKAHVFDIEISGLLSEVLSTKIMPPKNPLAFFRTPAPIVDDMVQTLQTQFTSLTRILEPSAGDGAIVEGILRKWPRMFVEAWELDPRRHELLAGKRIAGVTSCCDFLKMDGLWPAILMNPPFSLETDRLTYITHIKHAWDMLCPGGVVISVAPSSIKFRLDRRTTEMRELVEANGFIQDFPHGAFDVSGTLVNTVKIFMKKSGTVPLAQVTLSTSFGSQSKDIDLDLPMHTKAELEGEWATVSPKELLLDEATQRRVETARKLQIDTVLVQPKLF